MTTQNTAPPLTFDLRREPWIPIVRSDGSREELGLEDALKSAHKWRAISDPLPTVEFGIYRLLVAFVLDIFKPKEGRDWAKLWDAEQFDAERIAAYFDNPELEGAFDLFGDKPFLQSAGMDGEKSKPLAGLFHSMPSGINANHFHHHQESSFSVAPAVAARFLTTIAPFMTAGGPGLNPSINGAPALYVLPLGTNGFETVVMNCPVLSDLLLCEGNTPVHWRQTEVAKVSDQTSSSLLKALTWRPRRIQLVPDSKGGICMITGKRSKVLVSQMKFLPCWSTRFDWIDPNTAYRLGDKRTIMRLREGREVWRDTGPLALLRGDGKTHQRPAIISQISALSQDNFFDATQTLDMAIYGMRTDMKMKVFEWQRERLSVPMNLLWEDLAGTQAQEAMVLAEKVAYRLAKAIRIMAPPKKPNGSDNEQLEPRNPEALRALIDQSAKLFWRNLHAHYDDYLQFLSTRPNELAREEEFKKWRYLLRDEGNIALQFAIEDLDGDGRALKRQAKAYKNFRGAIFAIIEPQKAEEAKEKREAKKKEKTI